MTEDKVYSITELEAYLKCPFRYYAGSVLKLAPVVEREVEPTPPEIGQLMHRILEQFLKTHDAKGFEILTLMSHEIVSFQATRPKLSPVLMEYHTKKIIRTLESFVEDHIEEQKKERSFRPYKMEWRFGDRTDPLVISDGHGGTIRIRGRIDRIDVDVTHKRFLVIDYKTGSSKITGAEIQRGDSLQLPLYILAVQQLLLPDHKPVGGLYYQLSDMSKKELNVRWEKAMETSQERVREIVWKIREGRFESLDKPCDAYCPYQDICRLRSHQTLWTTQPSI